MGAKHGNLLGILSKDQDSKLRSNPNVRLIGHAVAAYFTGGSSLAASAAYESGEAQKENIKTQAKAEEFNAKNREIDRKRNLIRALSLQNVRGATSGTKGGIGSSQDALMTEDINRFELDQSSDIARTSQRVNQLQENAKTAGTLSLISAAGEVQKNYSRSKKRGKV